jgi:ketosteroid isomerase-like protein
MARMIAHGCSIAGDVDCDRAGCMLRFALDTGTRIVLEYLRLWASRRYDKAFELLGDDFSVWVGERQEFIEGRPFRDAAIGLRERFDDLSVRVGHTVSRAGRVAVELNIAGTTHDGAAVNRQYHFLMIVQAGKLRLMKEYVINAPPGSTNLWDMQADEIIELSTCRRSFLDPA